MTAAVNLQSNVFRNVAMTASRCYSHDGMIAEMIRDSRRISPVGASNARRDSTLPSIENGDDEAAEQLLPLACDQPPFAVVPCRVITPVASVSFAVQRALKNPATHLMAGYWSLNAG